MFERLFPISPDQGKAVTLILSFFVLRLVMSLVFPVTIDEAYAIVVSRSPSLSYFDHPALGFGFARLAAWLAGSEALVVVRFPHVVMGSLSAFLLYRVTQRSFGTEAAFYAVALYSISPFFLISSGHFVVPDGPLNFFLLATFWLVQPVLIGARPELTNARWMLAGLTLAAALLSKYQAVLFAVSALLYLVMTAAGRKSLLTKGPWLAMCIAWLGLVPTLVWNAQNAWASFAFQTGRAGDGISLHPLNFALMQLGQIAYLLPLAWAISHYMIWRSFFRPKILDETLFGIIAAVPIVIFDVIALMSDSNLPHWPMSGFLFALPLVGLWCVEMKARLGRFINRSFRAAIWTIPAIGLLFSLHTHTAIFTRFNFEAAPRFDVNWQLVAWDALAQDFDKRGILSDPSAFLIAKNWMEAARAAYALGPEIPVAPPLSDPRHFAFMSDTRLVDRKKGYAVMAALPGKAAEAHAVLTEMLGEFKVRGDSWKVLQTRSGFPAFEIVVIPVEPL
jgi:4-amino-4-deoxy-L-arabinose transferase-like glycosyltransferase